MRLVAHVAKRFRDRGIPYSDLLQEGFCGLLEAIDRFDLTHQTKLATYATWWIRQSMQRAVASGAYPVRLTPRHLRQLAQNQEELERLERSRSDSAGDGTADSAMTEMIHRIHTATRPTVSLDATYDSESSFNLLQTMSDPEGDRTGDVDTDEAVQRLIGDPPASRAAGAGAPIRPRRQGAALAQPGRKVLDVSKERVRQIQDRALQKLRAIAEEENLIDQLALRRSEPAGVADRSPRDGSSADAGSSLTVAVADDPCMAKILLSARSGSRSGRAVPSLPDGRVRRLAAHAGGLPVRPDAVPPLAEGACTRAAGPGGHRGPERLRR